MNPVSHLSFVLNTVHPCLFHHPYVYCTGKQLLVKAFPTHEFLEALNMQSAGFFARASVVQQIEQEQGDFRLCCCC